MTAGAVARDLDVVFLDGADPSGERDAAVGAGVRVLADDDVLVVAPRAGGRG